MKGTKSNVKPTIEDLVGLNTREMFLKINLASC